MLAGGGEGEAVSTVLLVIAVGVMVIDCKGKRVGQGLNIIDSSKTASTVCSAHEGKKNQQLAFIPFDPVLTNVCTIARLANNYPNRKPIPTKAGLQQRLGNVAVALT